MNKVLIIDDNPKNVEILKDFTEAWGYSTICAYQGIEALKIVAKEKPDIILLDVMLPGMSGFEVAGHLRSEEATQDIPIIMVSALASPEDRVNGFVSGADNFLVKPINYKELKAVMTRLLKRRENLLTREDERKILTKLLWIIKTYIITFEVDGAYPEENIKVLKNVLNRMNLDNIILGRALWVLRLQHYYEAAQKNPDTQAAFDKLLEGFRMSYWLRPMLAYSCQTYAERSQDLVKIIRERELEEIAEYCYIIKRFNGIFSACEQDVQKTLEIFRKEKHLYAYSESFCDALESMIEARELKKLLDTI